MTHRHIHVHVDKHTHTHTHTQFFHDPVLDISQQIGRLELVVDVFFPAEQVTTPCDSLFYIINALFTKFQEFSRSGNERDQRLS